VFGDALHTRIRKPHGVQHTAAKLGDPQRRVALARLRRHRLRDDTAEQIEVDDIIELAAKAGSAGSKKNRILEGGAEEVDGAHLGLSSRGPRGPGTGASNSTPAETGLPRVPPPCTPSSRASESSAAAYAMLGSPWNARV